MTLRTSWLALALAGALLAPAAHADPITVLFVGNSYTFGRVDPVMSYNTGRVNDLTEAMWLSNPSGSNVYEPHPWGGVPGIFERLTAQAGLDYQVSISARNAASLRGQLLNTNPAGWDLRGNIGSQAWDQIVLQEQSSEALPRQPGLSSNPEYTQLYTDLIENWAHQGAAKTYRERDYIGGTQEACIAIGYSSGACSTVRNLPANANASVDTQVYLYQTWARPNLVDGAFVTNTDEVTGLVTRTDTPATTVFDNLEQMTDQLRVAYEAAALNAAADGSGGLAGIAPVGQSFLRAVTEGIATRDMWADDAGTDGLIDLWFDDGTHASTYGSYLSALTLYGTLTGLDPALFGAGELAAQELGINATDAVALQRIASAQLGFTPPVPEPATALLALAGLAVISRRLRRSV
ncbi:MAG: hypothetical protein IV093_02070 [Rubrivivax sp.]|nr:hypothetical protein [Rubrivivax sp.]